MHANFDGGEITSDAGVMLLDEADERLKFTGALLLNSPVRAVRLNAITVCWICCARVVIIRNTHRARRMPISACRHHQIV